MSALDCVFRSVCGDPTVCLECCHHPGCAVCGSHQDLAQCDWPEWRFVTTRYSELKVGDRVRRAIERLKNRPAAMVATIEPAEVREELAHATRIHPALRIGLDIRGRRKEIVVRRQSLVMVERAAPCRAVVWELHRVERGPGATVCMAHWRAWEAAA